MEGAKKRCWVRKIYKERKEKGEFHLLIKDMKLFDHQYFFQHFRMTPSRFEELLGYIAPSLLKDAQKREPIGAAERLCVTLRFLVTGDAQTTIAASYRMSNTSVGRIIKETCNALWTVLLEKGFLNCPHETEWSKIAEHFESRWNFPNCIGAIDGKHVVMQAPARSGSYYYNYKGTHSIVLMAVVNAHYEFTLVSIGDSGRQSDGGVFAGSDIGYALNNRLLKIPKPRCPNGSNLPLPYVLVGDEAFPLKEYLVKPYAKSSMATEQRITNLRISRARNVVKNVFGICASRFRVLRRPIIGKVQTVEAITKAVVVLHNFLMFGRQVGEGTNDYCPAGYAEGDWRRGDLIIDGMQPISNVGSHNYSHDAKQIRDDFNAYFNSPQGSVPWQMDVIRRTVNVFDKA